MKNAPSVRRRRNGTIAWILLVLASMVLIGYGIWHADWHIWLPAPAEQEKVWIGNPTSSPVPHCPSRLPSGPAHETTASG